MASKLVEAIIKTHGVEHASGCVVEQGEIGRSAMMGRFGRLFTQGHVVVILNTRDQIFVLNDPRQILSVDFNGFNIYQAVSIPTDIWEEVTKELGNPPRIVDARFGRVNALLRG
ncbi:MAG TPA: hypothetical protein VI432_02985 [Candidatus Paceibacterota bacterium]